jgi:hypothetical protein
MQDKIETLEKRIKILEQEIQLVIDERESEGKGKIFDPLTSRLYYTLKGETKNDLR